MPGPSAHRGLHEVHTTHCAPPPSCTDMTMPITRSPRAASAPSGRTSCSRSTGCFRHTERRLLVAGSHGRVMYWEYEGRLTALTKRLADAGLALSAPETT